MANKKMTALCMAAMLAASLGSVASASESGILPAGRKLQLFYHDKSRE